MSGLLEHMRAGSEARIAVARASESEARLKVRALASPPPLALQLAPSGFDLIAEFKLRSPALGALDAQAGDPLERLRAYALGGAAAVSVLTEPSRFDGSLAQLADAAASLRPLGVPALRKDFLVEPYQLYEARACGASGALLILRMLPEARLIEMLECATELGLFVLLEAFDEEDLSRAAALATKRVPGRDALLVGLNCRDLDSLAVDFARFAALRDRMPVDRPAVAESGVQSTADAAAVAALGYRLALVGTSLMRRADPRSAVAELLSAGRAAAVRA